MPYDVRVRMSGGNVAWLRMAGRLCDWKMERYASRDASIKTGARRKSVTCDEPLCDSCTYSPAPNKDLCPTHAAQWKARTEAPA
jgi:hypothetical protein